MSLNNSQLELREAGGGSHLPAYLCLSEEHNAKLPVHCVLAPPLRVLVEYKRNAAEDCGGGKGLFNDRYRASSLKLFLNGKNLVFSLPSPSITTTSPWPQNLPKPGLTAQPCAFPRSNRIFPHSAGMLSAAGSSTCMAQRVTVPAVPSSRHSRVGVAYGPASLHTNMAPRTRLQSLTCSGRVGSRHTIHMSTGVGSVKLDPEHPGSGHVHSPRH